MQLIFYALYHNCFLVVELLFKAILNAEGSRYSNLFGITFPVHRQGYMLYALRTSHPTYKSGRSFGIVTWTFLQHITQGKSGDVPTKHAFVEFVFLWLFDRLHAFVLWACYFPN
jgi:hypothetical protein